MRRAHAQRGGKRKSSDRPVGQVEPAETFLIVCEGERTEPNYFLAFRAAGVVCRVDVRGEGYNTLSLVRKTIEYAEEESYDQVWCVFDRDSFPAQSFNEALELARRHNFHVAYSNEAFELWYLLHFHYYNTGISRSDYIERLHALLGRQYHKNDRQIYRQLLTRQPEAIRNARRLLAQYDPADPARDNPSTTVFQLVEALNPYLPENRLKALAENIH